jgi:hypothetical protein
VTITSNLSTFNEAGRALGEGAPYAGRPEARAAMDELRSVLQRKQQEAFPMMRAGYGAVMDEQLWEADTDVVVQGKGNRTLGMISVAFAANRNIAQVQSSSLPTLRNLRFSRSEYRWYRGGEFTYYDVDAPGDAEIGYWEGEAFTPVPKA